MSEPTYHRARAYFDAAVQRAAETRLSADTPGVVPVRGRTVMERGDGIRAIALSQAARDAWRDGLAEAVRTSDPARIVVWVTDGSAVIDTETTGRP